MSRLGTIGCQPRIKSRTLPIAAYASSALVLTLMLGLLIGLYIPHGRNFLNVDVFYRLNYWDGYWYRDIGQHGYSWNAALGAKVQQNIAFFPAQGLIDRLLLFVFGAHAPAAIIAGSLLLGITSIFSFESFARQLAPDRAVTAIWLFALWPVGTFYLMGYPAGITSICVIEALHASLRGKKWLAASWLGIGTAAAPTIVFAAAGIAIAQGVREIRPAGLRGIYVWVLWCGVAFAGLLLFVGYQAVAFHDPLAFIKAQEAWGKTPSFVGKLLRLSSPIRYLKGVEYGVIRMGWGASRIGRDASPPGRYTVEDGFQELLSNLWFCLILVGLFRATKRFWRLCPDLVLAGWGVYLGYVWFMVASDQQVQDSARLLCPAIAAFLGFATPAPVGGSFYRILSYLAALTAIETAFVLAGYSII